MYRRAYDIPDDLGTAVNVVQMVFGNKGDSLGDRRLLHAQPVDRRARASTASSCSNAQGEDVVAGIRTPEPIERCGELMPEAFAELVATIDRLERHYRDMQDIEFTVERRPALPPPDPLGQAHGRCGGQGRRRRWSREGLIDRDEAIRRIDPAQLDQLLHPMLDPDASTLDVAATGLNASPGAACGAVVLDADTAERRGKAGESVILVRWETAAADIHGLMQAKGIVTAHGGMTSHAAVVARGMGKPCVAGVESLAIDLERRGRDDRRPARSPRATCITIDGGTGRVIVGARRARRRRSLNEDFETILGWADAVRRLGVHANADTPADAVKARELGAEGIGLCRTEHMFMAAGAAARRARDDHGRRRGGAPRARSSACCRCSSPTSRGSSRRWPGCR